MVETPGDAQFRLLVESVKDYAIFLLDCDGNVQSWNAGAERIKGYRADEIIGKHFSTFYRPEDRAAGKPEQELWRAVSDGRVEDAGWRVRKDGSQFWANVVVTPLYEGTKHVGFAKITRDLTDRVYRTFVEATNAIVWTADALGRANADSPSWRAFTGQSEAEWLGLKGWDPVHPEDLPVLRVSWPAARDAKQPFEAEFRMRRHDGVYVWMACRAIPLLQADGSVREWFGVTFDISARKQAEAERARAEAWWRTTLSSIGDGVIATEADGRVRFLNAVAESLTGWTAQDAAGRSLREVFPIFNEETRAEVENPVDKVLREGKTVGLANHTVLVRRDGSERAIDDSAAPIRASNDGTLDGVVLVFRDVSAEKRELVRRQYLAQASDELMASTNYRDSLARVAQLIVPRLGDWCSVEILENGVLEQVAVAHVDPSKVDYARELNRRYPPDPNGDSGVYRVIRTGTSELYTEIPRELLERAAVDDEHRRIIRELDLRSGMVVPLRGREHVFGAITFIYAQSDRRYDQADLAFAEDLARRAAIIIERRKAQEDAEQANRAKDEFLATVSHELRTPLQAILGWASMLKRGTRDPAAAIDSVLRNATAQARLIDDILDVSRIISGKLRLQVARVDLASVIRSALDAIRPAASAKRIELVEQLSPELGAIDADADRLQQIVWNLVSNAVKFTGDGGRIEISAIRDPSTTRIVVRDTGVGIAPENLGLIFERFRQVDSSATRHHGGLGLGLAIVRYLVEAHGGTVTAASEGVDRGAVFTVTLPVRTAAEAARDAPRTPAGTLAGLRILVVDDDPDGRWLVGEALSEAGARVETAPSAPEAFALFTAQPHDVVVSDIGMPGEDGYSLARRLRATGRPTTLIALTAYARPEDIRASSDAGFQLHLGKPIDPDGLVAAIASAVTASTDSPRGGPSSRA